MRTIPLTQGKVALVDDASFEAVNAHKWHAHKRGRGFCAARNVLKPDGTRTIQLLHQFLMPGVSQIDHRDGNGCNDQTNNLRPATHRQNQQGAQRKRLGTTSRFRGVTWNKKRQKWQAQIYFDGKQLYLGLFKKEKDAAKAYDVAARKYFGDRADPNFPL